MCSLKFKDCRLKDKILIENITSLKVLELYNCYNFDENSELGFNENGNEKIEYLCIKNFNLNENISIFKLRNLKYLNLQANDIELSFELFNDLSNLEELRIDINKETEFSSLHSSGNNNLDNIYLQKLTRLKLNCKIERLNILPTDLFTDLKHLKSLKLSLIRTIQSLPNRVFSPLVCLEDLVINGNLEKLDRNVFEGLVKLKSLDLSINQIKELSHETFTHLKKLENLDLSWNGIKHLKQGIFSSLPSLKNLELTGNKLTEIEDNLFEGVENLETIIINVNKIEYIGIKTFSNLNHLKKLNLGKNIIEILNDEIFSHLINLEFLELHGNRIKEIRTDAFKGLGNLKKLDLSKNQIIELTPGTFSHLKKLRELILYGNKIKRLLNRLFFHLNSLQSLNLSFNPIEKIEENAFENLDNLRELELRQTEIGLISYFDVFRGLKSLEILVFDESEFEKKEKQKELFRNFFGKTLILTIFYN